MAVAAITSVGDNTLLRNGDAVVKIRRYVVQIARVTVTITTVCYELLDVQQWNIDLIFLQFDTSHSYRFIGRRIIKIYIT